MNWEKLKTVHYHKDPVEHIYSQTIFDQKEYDRLYENQNNLEHQVWKEFDEKYCVGYQLLEDIREINRDKEVMCLWFFKERNDRSAGVDIKMAGHMVKYHPNSFLVTESKDIKILERKNGYIRRPVLQIDLSLGAWKKILERFNKVV